jgi:ElaB/YqjD/DUF883 family membrane-anchored ribosome-binding protein
VERQLATDLKAVLKEAEDLIDSTSGASDEALDMARERLNKTLDSLRSRWNRLESMTTETARAARNTVREHPYETAGAGVLAVAFLAGAFWMWRNSR